MTEKEAMEGLSILIKIQSIHQLMSTISSQDLEKIQVILYDRIFSTKISQTKNNPLD